jgi:hypothetical protein
MCLVSRYSSGTASLVGSANRLFGAVAFLLFVNVISISPASAITVTDAFGNTCDITALIENPFPPPLSICPASLQQASQNKAKLLAAQLAELKRQRERLQNELLGLQVDWAWQDFINSVAPIDEGSDLWNWIHDQIQNVEQQLGQNRSDIAITQVQLTAAENGVVIDNGHIAKADPAVFNTPHSSGSYTTVAGAVTFDLSRWLKLPKTQSLTLKVVGSGNWGSVNVDPTDGTATSGHLNDRWWTIGARARYGFDRNYLAGSVLFSDGRSSGTQEDGGTGSTNISGSAYLLEAGRIFTIWSAPQVRPSPLIVTKVPPARPDGWLMVFLDLSGRLGYLQAQVDPFTTSTGFVFGNQTENETFVGLKARIAGLYLSGNFWAEPYAAVTYDHAVHLSDTINFGTGSTADFAWANLGRDTWRVEGGVKTFFPRYFVDVEAHYSTNSDTKAVGGSVTLHVPM